MQLRKWSDYLCYDERSKSCLRWKVDRMTGRNYSVKVISAGDDAGTEDGNGYWAVQLNRRLTCAHRIIFEMFNGEIPKGMQVDHIDGNIKNNKIRNLRLVTNRENSMNQRMRSDNSSGVTGVRFCNSYNRWIAYWVEPNGKRHGKYFSVAKLGFDEAKKLAIEHRNIAVSEMNINGAKYTERHGK